MDDARTPLTADRPVAGAGLTGAVGGLVAIAVLAVVWLIYAWPWISGDVIIPWDGAAHFAPQVQFMAHSFANGEWPFWNPYVFAGQVQIADPQSMLFSPPMLVLALTNPAPSLRAINVTVLAMLLVGGSGVLWFAADRGWHYAACLVAALAFAFGSVIVWRLQHFEPVFSQAYYPFAIVLLARALNRASILYGGLAGLVAALLVLSRNQVGLLCIYLLIAQVVWHWINGPGRLSRAIISLKPLIAGAVVGLAIIAIPILMTLQLAEISNRPAIDYAGAAAASMHPALLVTAISPHVFAAAGPMAEYWGPPSATWRDTGLFLAQNMGILYIGALPFVMLVVGLIKGDFLRREMAFFVAAFIFVTLYALGGYTPAFWLFYEIMPGVDLFRRPADAAYLVGGVGALLAGYALDRRLKSTDAPLTYVQMAAAAALVMAPFIIALGLAVRFDRVAMAATPLLIAAAWIIAAVAVFTLALWLRPIRPALAGLLLVGLTAADLRWNNGPNGSTALPASQFTFLEPSGRDPVMTALGSLVRKATTQTHRPRVELIGLGFHTPNASMTYALENTLGYNPVRLKPYVDATGATDLSGLPDPRPTTPMFPRYNAPLAHLLGLRFIATKTPLETLSPTTPKDFLRLVRRMPEGNIYENPQTLPRVMFATQARNADFTTIVRTGIWPDVDLATTVLLQHFGKDIKIRRPGTARIVTYRNTELVVETDGPDGGWLVLNDLWHPWWRVEVNGKPAQLLRADVLFRAVAVPPGKASVRFVFRPVLGALEGLVRREPSVRSR